jgi:hypothetical protein|tara:strand:+ start:1877 stop:2077 length:201 start_codon:yes stop_codon:yes gene_type:complete
MSKPFIPAFGGNRSDFSEAPQVPYGKSEKDVIDDARASAQRIRELNYPFGGSRLLKKPPHPIPPMG